MLTLGDLVKEIVTGFEGVITGYTVHMNNCDRAHVQPQGMKDGKALDSMWWDVTRLQLVKEGVVEYPFLKASPFNMGDEVADTLTKFRGKVVGHASYLSGCLHIGVQSPNLKEDGQPVEVCWIPAQQLNLIKAAKTAKPRSFGGGPMRDPVGVRDPK